MNAATNVKQIQGNHAPITPLVGFVALLAIALVGVRHRHLRPLMSLTGASFAVAQCPTFSLAGFGSTRLLRCWCEFVVLFAVAAGLTYLVSHK